MIRKRKTKSSRQDFTQGFYNIQNPKKYLGKKPPIYRSSWEYRLMIYLDESSKITYWNSESFSIQYYDPVRNRKRNYFPDFFIIRDGVRIIIEVKPSRETKQPRKTPKKKQSTLLYEQMTYATNQAKWEAAKVYCKKKGWEFEIMTEKDLDRLINNRDK